MDSIGEGISVLAIAAAVVAYFYLESRERLRRLELVHQERLAAMEKGVPLPELPIDPPRRERPPDRRAPLIIGIVLAAFGFGSMVALRMVTFGRVPTLGDSIGIHAWPLPLPIALIGVGLILFYLLARNDR